MDYKQDNLFSKLNPQTKYNQPLADRIRPETIDEMVGQKHLLEKGRLLRRAIEADSLTSSIFYGPPGCGKTTLARIIAKHTKANFVKLNAVISGVADVRNVIKDAEERQYRYSQATYLLLDECHRWSKTQSDSILPAVESGLIRFIGSTTENPSASMTPAIVSRCRVFRFLPLSVDDVKTAILNALNNKEKGLGQFNTKIDDDALEYIATTSSGDVRSALSALELAVLSSENINGLIHIDLATAKECVQTPLIGIDKQKYYDMISAMIKSMRGSDSNAAIFWLARLLHAGVDPKVIARRIMVHASEDVGLADPMAMLQAHAAVKATEFVGMPEARIPLAQAVIAISEAEKSNSVVMAIDNAMIDAEMGESIAVPNYLCDHSYAIKGEDKGEYLYPHDYPNHVVKQNYMPKGYENKKYYIPSDEGMEKNIKVKQKLRLDIINKQKKDNSV